MDFYSPEELDYKIAVANATIARRVSEENPFGIASHVSSNMAGLMVDDVFETRTRMREAWAALQGSKGITYVGKDENAWRVW